MKIVFNGGKLLKEALALVSKAASTKTTIPSLSCVKIEVANGAAKLTCYDLTTGIIHKITESIEIYEEGTALVNAKTLAGIAKKVGTNDRITIETDGSSNVTVENGKNMHFVLPTQDVTTYPELPKVTGKNCFRVPFGNLKTAVQQTLFAVANDDELNLQKGCCFTLRLKGDNLIAVGLDGYRVAINRSKVENPEAVEFEAKIPKDIMSEVAKFSAGVEDDVLVFYDNKNLVFQTGNTRIFGRLYTGTIFPLESLKLPEATIVAETAALIDAIDALMPLVTATAKTVVMKVQRNVMSLKLTTELGSAETKANIEGGENTDLIIAFNANYLADVVSHIESENVKISLSTPSTPIKVVDGANNEFVVLPVKINQSAAAA